MSQENKGKPIRIQSRVDTRANWEAPNSEPLLDREIGYEAETGQYKIGKKNADGQLLHWNDLPYAFGMGKKTEDNGEIFNDYDNNQALTKYSTAIGSETMAGQKGFKILSVDLDYVVIEGNIKDYGVPLPKEVDKWKFSYSAYTPDGWQERNDIISIGGDDWVNENQTFLQIGPLEGITNTVLQNFVRPDGRMDGKIWFSDYPNAGEYDIATKTLAGGRETKAQGDASFAFGRANQTLGPYSVALGRDTYAAGDSSIALGKRTKALEMGTMVSGVENIASRRWSSVRGSYNYDDPTKDYIDIVGNGQDKNNRSNAYLLERNGTAWFAGDVYSNNKQLSTIDYTDNQIDILHNFVDTSLEQKLNKETTEKGGFAAGRGAVVSMTGSTSSNSNGTGVALGLNAYTAIGGVAAGKQAYCQGNGAALGLGAKAHDGVAIGKSALAVNGDSSGTDAIAIGNSARASNQSAIQLGTGDNINANTLQVFNYTLLNADGTIPTERLSLIKDYIDNKFAEIINGEEVEY